MDMTTAITIRIDDDLKNEMDTVARNLGTTTTGAITMFARQFVARRGFPFPIVEPIKRDKEGYPILNGAELKKNAHRPESGSDGTLVFPVSLKDDDE